MKLTHLKSWVNSLPEEFDDFDMVFRELKILDVEYIAKVDTPIVATTVDNETKEICFYDRESITIFDELDE